MRKLLGFARICRIASTGPKGAHVAPLCPAFDGEGTVYIETAPTRLTIRNLAHSAEVVILVDECMEDWSRLWMLSLTGRACTLTEGREFDKAVGLLRQKFSQFEAFEQEIHFILAIDITGVRHWEGVKP